MIRMPVQVCLNIYKHYASPIEVNVIEGWSN